MTIADLFEKSPDELLKMNWYTFNSMLGLPPLGAPAIEVWVYRD